MTTTVEIKHKAINIIFDGPPSHESGRFVEVETDDGKSISIGEWIERPDGLWSLRIEPDAELEAELAVMTEALERLSRLGNEPHLGNSDGNMIARGALEAKLVAVEKRALKAERIIKDMFSVK
jgi:hypothetical protein